jgi:hypothetical protein
MAILGFKHSGNWGDICYALPAIKEYFKKTGKQSNLYLKLGQIGYYYDGATHPVQNDLGQTVMLNKRIFNKIKPLLEYQPYISQVLEYQDNLKDKVIDLDVIRTQFVNMPYSCLSRAYFYIFPDLACNLSDTFLYLPITDVNYAKNKIIINRSERYLNPHIDYSFLKKYENRIVFSGLQSECDIFCKQFGLNIPLLQENNFLELAHAINQCDLFIGNQSSNFAMAQMLKTPRILEVCNYAPNVICYGENAFDFYRQAALEYYFDVLYNKARFLGELEKTDKFHNNKSVYTYNGIECVVNAEKYHARIYPIDLEQDLGKGKGISKFINIK